MVHGGIDLIVTRVLPLWYAAKHLGQRVQKRPQIPFSALFGSIDIVEQFAHDDASVRALFHQMVMDRQQHGARLVLARPRLRDRTLHHALEAPGKLPHHLSIKLFLAAEVVQQSLFCQPHLGRDRGNRDAVITALGKQPMRRIDEFLSCFHRIAHGHTVAHS